MAKKTDAKWYTLNPAMFPAEVQGKLNAAAEARKALQESKVYKTVQEAEKAAIAAIQGFGDRIAVPGDDGNLVKVLQTGHTLAVSLKWGKLTVASVAKGSGSQSKAVLA